jgi:hypothetical protein
VAQFENWQGLEQQAGLALEQKEQSQEDQEAKAVACYGARSAFGAPLTQML